MIEFMILQDLCSHGEDTVVNSKKEGGVSYEAEGLDWVKYSDDE